MKAFERVFALVPDCHTAGRYRGVWQRHFYDGLIAALPSVVLPREVDFEWARPAAHASRGPSPARTETSERLWDQIRAANEARALDAVISYCFAADLEPALVERTTALGIPWINFFCDSTYAFDLVEGVARVASLNWFPEHAAAANYRALGRPSLCRPYAVAAVPDASCRDAKHSLGFVGVPTGNRVFHLAGLALRGCVATVRGHGWRRTAPASRPRKGHDPRTQIGLAERLATSALVRVIGRGAQPLADAELPDFLASCRVVLGLNEGRDLDRVYRSYMKLRDIELPGYGCCYLTQHNEDVEHAFEIGREVMTFRTVGEAAAQIRRSVRDPARAREMGQAARRRVLAEHTWPARLGELARAL